MAAPAEQTHAGQASMAMKTCSSQGSGPGRRRAPGTPPVLNTNERYGMVAICVHWLMAVVLITLVGSGLYMVSLPDAGFDKTKIQLILFHKQLGVLALGAVALRFVWRLGNALPSLVETLAEWQKVSARFVHLSFYVLMFALPMSGWVMSSAAAIPVSVFGLFTLPDLVSPDEHLFRVLIDIHRWLGYALIACLCVHVGAAVRHHVVLKDDTLRKMLPWVQSP
jgi:cytochrome b561